MPRSLLHLMPVDVIGKHFSAEFGRPTKELYAMCGLLLMSEFRNFTVDQTADAWSFDASFQFALDLPRDRQYLCARSVDNYRKLLRESDAGRIIYEEITAELVKVLGHDIRKQRVDSTHVLSRMAVFGRLKLLTASTKRFLVQLRRHLPGEHEAVPAEIRDACTAAESRLFGEGTTDRLPQDEALLAAAEHMLVLTDMFTGNQQITAWSSFQALNRIFKEHCEVTRQGKTLVRIKSLDENGQSSRTLQNPSDPGAGYSGHKGAGYQMQLSQAYDTGEGTPGLIVCCVPQSAAESDSAAMPLIIEQQKRMGTLPEEVLADTAYGGSASVAVAAAAGVTLVAPVPGRKAEPETIDNKEQELCAVMETVVEPAAAEVASQQCCNKSHTSENEDGAKISGQPPAETAGPEELAQNAGPQSAAERRNKQNTKEWKEKYKKRSGIEGVNAGLKQVTGCNQLKVKGKAAVFSALYLKVAGWNIRAAAKSLMAKLRQAAKAAAQGGESAGKEGFEQRCCVFRSKNRVGLPQGGHRFLPGSFMEKICTKPPDILYTALSQPLKAYQQYRHRFAFFSQTLNLLLQPLRLACDFTRVLHALLPFQFVLLVHHQIVRQTDEHRLHRLRRRRARPGLFLVHFVFQLIIDLLKIPPHLVESCYQAWLNRHFIGQEIENFSALWTAVLHVPHHDSTHSDLFVDKHTGVDRIGRIPGQRPALEHGRVAFGAGEEIDSALFKIVPEVVVNACHVVNIEYFLTLRSALPEGGDAQAFEGAHFMLAAARDLVGDGKVRERVGAHVQRVNVAGGELRHPSGAALALLLRVMHCGGV